MKSTVNFCLTLTVLFASAFLFSACSVLPQKKDSTPPYIDETGKVDQQSFEQDQTTSEDEAIDTIEAELEETVILDEDFSDLE